MKETTPAGPVVEIERLPHGEGLPLPAYATAGSAGADLRAAVADELWIPAGERRLVPTGLRVAIPAGFEGQVRPRSGLAVRHGVTLPNTPGTIDADYRGEIQVALVNLSPRPFRLRRGDRIAQLVVAPVAAARFEERAALTATARGDGGFGSTGSG
ncbi:MAG TPA: dUTP diphosphatase [Thermoanaerobaculia bacterium]|jgi:dUTP pyrophosphatase